MKKAPIGLFYGSSTCYTEMAAENIQQQFGTDQVDIFNIADIPITHCNNYQQLILGIPTWDYGELQEDWEDCWNDIDQLSLSGVTIALYGLGDQIGYPKWFLDAMGYLHNKVVIQGATIIGYWPIQGYTFDQSQALTPDQQHFVGLALDDENEFEKTDERIAQWCNELKQRFTLNN
ncbi:flavodoxin FldB [Candidatus Endobugula sertula]|uniref:Flavodoxin n=1 Tax=Candidatus Endobugula sertula TaxID=62101 RepID=A0A1D2QNH8_9GAMM|nr:flavodoxin FldB [Candidatus Endobugula sertula]